MSRSFIVGSIMLLIISLSYQAYAKELNLTEGVTLFYGCGRVSTGIGGYEVWNATVKILIFNQSTLVFESNSSATNSTLASRVIAKYQNGIPKYVDYLTALIYLPSECMTTSLQGNLQWATQLETLTGPSTITDKTGFTSNVTVEAGTFQSINITLDLVAGLDSGALSLIYDVNSGILVYEQWTPAYGDIIILSLTDATYSTAAHPFLLSIALFAATITTPTALAIDQTRKTLRKRSPRPKQRTEGMAKSSLSRKPLFMILVGAFLNLASVFSPWTQPADLQTYLPLSLTSTLAEPSSYFASTNSFLAISLMVHAAAITAWLSVATYLYSRKLTRQVTAIASIMLTLCSAVLFLQNGWTVSWGLPITVTGGILIVMGLATAKTRMPPTKQKES